MKCYTCKHFNDGDLDDFCVNASCHALIGFPEYEQETEDEEDELD